MIYNISLKLNFFEWIFKRCHNIQLKQTYKEILEYIYSFFFVR
jgi:hypothetical protein